MVNPFCSCRLCNKNMYDMKNIFQQTDIGYEMSLVESIEVFFSIKIENNDRYSKMLCANCLTVIELIHLHRKRFRNKQKFLKPIAKEESDEEDNPPVLEPYYSHDSTFKDNTSENSTPSKTENSFSNQRKSIKVPLQFFEQSNIPRIEISSKEKRLADNMLCGENKHYEKRKQRRKELLYLYYKKRRPGAIRELIQDRARGELYLSHLEEENRLKSIYEYSFNLNPNVEEESESLWKLDAQLSVLVCEFCNEVFYTEQKLTNHQAVHEKFKMRMKLFEVIF